MYINLIHRPVVQVKDTVQCMDHDLQSPIQNTFTYSISLHRGMDHGHTENSIITI